MQTALARPAAWWMLLLFGAIQLVAGVLALSHTDITLLWLGLIFGVNLLLIGGLLIMFGAGEAGVPEGIRAVRIAVGALTVLAGLIAIVRPGESVLVLLLCLAFWFVLTGISSLVEAVHGEHRLLQAAIGLVSIAAGVIVVGDPDIGLQTLADLTGILLIVRGCLELAAGFYVRAQS